MDAMATVFPQDKHARLAELGLAEEFLIQALSHGLLAWANCTENDAPPVAGYYFWSTTVRALRDTLALVSWHKNDDGVPLVENETGTIAILVVPGNAGTGRADRNVSTKRSRGPETIETVQINQRQLRLFELEIPVPVIEESSSRQVWMLLFSRNMIAREIRCELSLPIRMSDNARPDDWRERIILDAIPFDDDVIYPDAIDPSTPFGQDVDVRVERRV